MNSSLLSTLFILMSWVFSATQVLASEPADFSTSVTETARGYLRVPYKFGDTGHRGLDCSAFVQRVFADNGVSVPRTVKEQARSQLSTWVEQPKPGDLVFFKNTYKRGFSHVGIYVGDNQMIHASTEGRKIMVASLANPYFKKHFAGFKRIARGASSSSTFAALQGSPSVQGTYTKNKPIPFWVAATGLTAGVVGGLFAPSSESKAIFASSGFAVFSVGVVWGNKTRFKVQPRQAAVNR